MEAGGVEWTKISTDPLDLLHRAIAATSSLFEKSNLKFIQDFPSNLPKIFVDPDRIIQVLINLISNAFKFTEYGSVTCCAKIEKDELIISVIDTGIGIAPQDCTTVFERFRQVGNVLTNKPKGTGLGLPICQQIIEHHQGRIWVESQLGRGSKFSFALPLDQNLLTKNYD
jgi:signal transduction histidine kinase